MIMVFRRHGVRIAAAFSLVFFAAAVAAAGDNTMVVRAARTMFPPVIDGVLRDSQWALAEPATEFRQWFPHEGDPGTERTEIRVLYDDGAIYFGAMFYDSEPDKIVKPFTRRDNEMESDWGSIRIDSYHDHQTAYEFTFNPSGVKVDILMYDDGAREDVSWDPVWYVETAVTPEGWTAEVKIPFSVLRYRPVEGEMEWGINFVRTISRKQERALWSYFPRNVSGFVSRWGHLRGLENLPDPRQLEIVPFVVGRQSWDPATEYRPAREEFTQELGADIRYGISKSFTIDATINPDFGQVEADPAVLNLSTIETFYPEKRPFFIEGTQFIRFTTFGGTFGPGMFYTRRIGRGISEDELNVPDGGQIVDMPLNTRLVAAAKLNGKTGGGLSVGILEAFTDEETGVVSDSAGVESSQRLEPFGYYNVVRLKQDLLENSYAGMIFTSVAKTSRAPAFTAGGDWNVKLADKKYGTDGFVALSHTNGPEGSRVTGSAGKASFSRISAEHWLWSAGVDYTTPKYNINDIGFFFRPDDYGGSASLTYREIRPATVVREYLISGSFHERLNFDNVNLFNQASLSTDVTFMNYWGADARVGGDWGLYDDRETRGKGLYRKPFLYDASVGIESDSREPVVGSLEVRYGWNSKILNAVGLGLGLEFKPTSWMRWFFETEYQHVGDQEAWILNMDAEMYPYFGDRFTDENNFVLRGTLAFNRELTLELYGQVFLARGHYDNYRILVTDRDFVPAASTPELESANFNEQSLNTNVVFRWEYLPGSTMYFVWSQARGWDDGLYATPIRENFRNTFQIPPANVLMLKISYWWNV